MDQGKKMVDDFIEGAKKNKDVKVEVGTLTDGARMKGSEEAKKTYGIKSKEK